MMPDLDWNKRWGEQAKAFLEGDKYFNQHEIYGYQWGDPHQTSAAFIVPEYLQEYLRPEFTVLEIGPGGGRYTQFLGDCKKLYMVEYNTQFFPILKNLLSHSPAEKHYIRSPGCSFAEVPSGSIDFVFSFDCFVHLDIPLIEGYLSEIKRVLASKGIAVIHYADKRKPMAQKQGTNFSPTTPEIMHRLLNEAGFSIIKEDTERISHSAIVAFRSE
jgi:SAM-dependent methyltransferase